MYQKTGKMSEEIFDFVQKDFEEYINFKFSVEDNSEWDLKSKYTPNKSSFWNNPKFIGKPCTIISKNNYMAFVQFDSNEEETTKDVMYELGNLTKIN